MIEPAQSDGSMSDLQQAPRPGGDYAREVAEPARLAVPRAPQRPARWSARRRRDAWLLLVALLLGVATIFALAGGGTRSSSGSANVIRSGRPPATATKAQSITSPALTATGEFQEYPLPQSDSQLMRPAIDHEGRLWFGEMGRNYLAVFDPRTRTFRQMTPPHGRFGVMSVQVASDDTIWFVEQYANYIGHYYPTTGHYQVYPLPMLTVPDPSQVGKTLTLPGAPNELALDARGTVWFTEFNADAVGSLDPSTGLMRHYPLAAKRTVQTLVPYGVTVDPQGMVWFTEMSGEHVGRLDPTTGRIRLFAPPGSNMPPMEIASDTQGIIWVTTFSTGLLLRLDPRTGAFTSYAAPFSDPHTGGLYGLAMTAAGEVWVTVLAENVIARLDVAAHRFISYRIPTPGSEPLGIVMGPDHTFWFTEVDKIGMLRP